MQLSRKINGDRWKFIIISEDQMKTDHQDAAAVCLTEEKEIHITPGTLTLGNLRHELFHAYFSYLYLDDTNTIAILDFEEIMATFFASKGEEMLQKADKIFRDLQKLVKKGNE